MPIPSTQAGAARARDPFGQHAADLPLPHQHVVGPLQVGGEVGNATQTVGDGEPGDQR